VVPNGSGRGGWVPDLLHARPAKLLPTPSLGAVWIGRPATSSPEANSLCCQKTKTSEIKKEVSQKEAGRLQV